MSCVITTAYSRRNGRVIGVDSKAPRIWNNDYNIDVELEFQG